jgi:hypothetical protein
MKIPGLRFWRPHAVVGALGIVLSLAVNGQEPQRSWSNGKGQSISAQLSDIDVDKGTVSLVREDGAPFVLPIASLSVEDQGYIDGDIYSDAETSWELPLGPLQVVSKSQVIVAGYSGQTGMPFLLDLENQTFSPIGQPATPEVDGSAHFWQPAISPGGTYLVHYDRAKGAFMQLDLGRSSD